MAREADGIDNHETRGPIVYLSHDGQRDDGHLDIARLRRVVGEPEGSGWIHIDSSRDDEWALLSELFAFHPLAIEDTRSPECRIKIEDYEGYLFVVVREIRFNHETPEPYDFDISNLYLFIGPRFLVTVRDSASPTVSAVGERLRAAPELAERGADYVAHMVIDTAVDLYFPLLDEIDDFVEALEAGVLSEHSREVMGSIFELKRTLMTLRRHLGPMREVAGTLANRPSPHLQGSTQIYFRDVYDHVLRQVEAVETYRDMLTSALEIHFAAVSNRMNEVMKALSVIATVVLPPTLVASVYGMNFDVMPGLHAGYGFWMALAFMVIIAGGFVAYLSWKRWL